MLNKLHLELNYLYNDTMVVNIGSKLLENIRVHSLTLTLLKINAHDVALREYTV